MASVRLPFSIQLLVIAVCFSTAEGCFERERVALLDFKKSFYQSNGILLSWNVSSEDCCGWEEIKCDDSGVHVVELNLGYLGLQSNHLRPSLAELQHLHKLSFDGNNFSMRIPEFIGSFKELEELSFSEAGFYGSIPPQLGNLCNLDTLSIDSCSINDSLPGVIQTLGAGCASASLYSLDLSSTNLTGLIPPMLMFPSLTELYLDDNQLERFASHNTTHFLLNTHSSHIFPPTLKYLSISDNALSGVLLSEHFANISHLHHLDLTDNPKLTVNFSEPLREVGDLYLSSCNVGPGFPTWILASLAQLNTLDLSNSKLSGSLPTIFWTNLPSTLSYLNLSSNSILSVLPNLQNLSFLNYPAQIRFIDLTSNNFYGPLPLLFLKATELHLSNNKISKFSTLPHLNKHTTPNDDFGGTKVTTTLDISDNNLSGEIPDCAWVTIFRYENVNLSHNNLSGKIPSSTTTNLYVLNLRNNRFVGQIPSSLKYSTSMRILDLSQNRFSGLLPSWLGEGLESLKVLSVESNNFTGTLPKSLCQLRSLQILDLSNNKLSGTIPSCVSNFVAMTHDVNLSSEVYVPDLYGDYLLPIEEAGFYEAWIKWKGVDRLFHRNLELASLIDLSNNNLSGIIPSELMSLTNLDSLDLSSNNFTGRIPSQIGQLKALEYLNMSLNNISGLIPIGLAGITTLGVLDLSHNKLSGRIPKGTQLQTFDSSSFIENSGLCGAPLEVKCLGDADDSIQPLQC